jgi:hypothetical protein
MLDGGLDVTNGMEVSRMVLRAHTLDGVDLRSFIFPSGE